ncbi:MAG: HDOD domain-containing protein [bacterium]
MTTATLDNKVRQVVSNIQNLPTPPIVFHQIQKVINDPDCSAAKVAAILAEDPAMSVKVLKLTNSAFYGLSREVNSVKQAVVIVGIEAIKNLVLSASVLDMFKGSSIDQEAQEKFWRHSLATGYCCRILSKKLQARGIIDQDTAFSAGLLHDLGKLVFSCFLDKEYTKLKDARKNDRISQDFELENQILGYNHAQIGGFLSVLWKLPQKLGEAISYHHNPHELKDENPLVNLVHISNYIAKKTFYEQDEQAFIGHLDNEVLKNMEIEEQQLEEYSEVLREEYLKAETFMKMVGLS